jgi:glycosyltransferase involved in cell wall biosynthesis
MNSPLASVVIPTRNRLQAIENCLDALAAQTLPSGSFEVLVVDDGSEPALALAPARWASKFELKVIRQQNTGPAGARNYGVAEARGEFIAFTDDDCLPTPTWLEKLAAALREKPGALVGGSTFNGLKEHLFSETSQLILEMVYEHFNRDPANAYFFASNNMALRRDGFLEIGGFDLTFRVASEDREFCDRWRMQRRKLVYEKAAQIEHRHPLSLAGFCGIHWRYGQGAFVYKDKRMARNSGTMVDDLRFHRAWPRILLKKVSRYPINARVKIFANLITWQIANAAGFFRASCRTHFRI